MNEMKLSLKRTALLIVIFYLVVAIITTIIHFDEGIDSSILEIWMPLVFVATFYIINSIFKKLFMRLANTIIKP